MPSPNLRIPWFVWWPLIRELKRRGGGRRESGAFLLGSSGTQQVTHFICYDDLDPTTLDTGIIVRVCSTAGVLPYAQNARAC